MAPNCIAAPVRPRSPHEVLERYRRERSPADKEWLVERFLPLALHLARRYRPHGDREDVEQVATLGLLKAIERFDPDRGVAFTSFAVPTIGGEVKRYFRDLGWLVRVPRELQELAARADAATVALTGRLRRAPTVAEVAEACEHHGRARAGRARHRDRALRRLARRARGGRGRAWRSSCAPMSPASRSPSGAPILTSCCRRCRRASGRSCACGSSRTSRSARSRSGWGSRRCRSRGCCDGRSPRCRSERSPSRDAGCRAPRRLPAALGHLAAGARPRVASRCRVARASSSVCRPGLRRPRRRAVLRRLGDDGRRVAPRGAQRAPERAAAAGGARRAPRRPLRRRARERFDLILANPPYLPGPAPPRRGAGRATDAGADGRALLDRICAGAPDHLRAGGIVLVVQSEVCDPGRTLEAFVAGGLEAEVSARHRGRARARCCTRAVISSRRQGGCGPGRRPKPSWCWADDS